MYVSDVESIELLNRSYDLYAGIAFCMPSYKRRKTFLVLLAIWWKRGTQVANALPTIDNDVGITESLVWFICYSTAVFEGLGVGFMFQRRSRCAYHLESEHARREIALPYSTKTKGQKWVGEQQIPGNP